ncbi:kinesin-like protein KIN-7M, chloroplastic [Cucurbita maxima]|uniref:Kinesin-like protein KIN-7M, chloroplastic n=1 Tax=Cucurbita maxima TaxID=3661 RepID=A0A6J1I0Z4_CUCMA|nr:kinesin-like protein KIN-7M, chloroplastic [Cucurbita maxima]
MLFPLKVAPGRLPRHRIYGALANVIPAKSRPRASPFSHRKSVSSSSSSQSPSSFTNGKMIPRSCSSSASSHYGMSSGFGSRSMVNGGGYGDCSPVGFISDDLMSEPVDEPRNGDSISVTIRFRPLSEREFLKGDEIAWYADGDKIVRNEYNPATAYGFDKVFGPDTISPEVYEVAAKPVVKAAMEGVHGTVFAYGVTSSGKTHTMHGDQNSPGIIPLAIKDVFSIIQDTPGREFLLRVSYLEIYNEVINDLLDPTGQNLRVREDAQGTYVEGIKEEVVLSPGHALSFIAAGEEHRHVGSNNFNLFSSRSHTIFTLMIESSARGDEYDGVIFSQLNLIDLAGSESSKTETTGLRRKEGAYINKSLLTLGTVIGKLSEGKASHVPYRDSKLTRLLQSSLSGHGHVSLICTVTPASSNMEETHNTLKFASRAKRVEIYASRNKIIDEKSLIKKYQTEISILKQELDQLKRGMLAGVNHEEIMNLRQQLEEGQVKMQSRLEEEEEAKVALMSRIQRLTKLILVSSKNSIPGCLSDVPSHQRNKSSFEDKVEVTQGLLSGSENQNDLSSIVHSDQLNGELLPADSTITGSSNGEMTMSDQMDLLVEQVKMLAEEIAFETSALKRLIEQSVDDPDGSKVQIQNLEQEIQEKKRQMRALEQRINEGSEPSISSASMVEMQQTVTRLTTQCGEKEFELEKLSSRKICRRIQKKIQSQEIENEKLKLESVHFSEEISGLHVQNQKLAEEASYAKELASAAAVELKNLAAEVTKLSLQNAKLEKELLSARELAHSKNTQNNHSGNRKYIDGSKPGRKGRLSGRSIDVSAATSDDFESWNLDPDDLKMELHARKQREEALEAALAEKELLEDDYRKKMEEAKKREAALENDLANMWVLVAKLKKEAGGGAISDVKSDARQNSGTENDIDTKTDDNETITIFKEDADPVDDSKKSEETHEEEPLVVRLKARMQVMKEKDLKCLENVDTNSHTCKVCFELPTAAILLPCRHFCLCKSCSLACSECPICRTKIVDRLFAFTS